MNILFLTENFPPERNAAASRVHERACYWVRWGHQVTVLTCVPNFPEGRVHPGYRNRWYQTEEIDGIRVIRVKTLIAANEGVVYRTVDFLSFMLTAFVFGLFLPKPDVVVATSPQFFAAVGGWALAGCRRRPFVFELSDLWPASISAVGAIRNNLALRMLEKLELFLYRRSAAVVALTESFKQDLVRRGVPPDKVTVVINGVDLTRYSPRPRDKELAAQLHLGDCFVAGYIGTHGMAHALERVLDAAEMLRGNPLIRFLFVGAGAARSMLVAEAGRRRLNNLHFVPAQPKGEIQRYWSLCNIALVHLKDTPLFTTVIPSKIFEALAMGLPVLFAGPDGEAARIIRENECGLVVPAERPEALAKALVGLFDNPAQVRSLSRKALASAQRFTRERQAQDMLAAITNALACQPHARRHVPDAPAVSAHCSPGLFGLQTDSHDASDELRHRGARQ